MELGVLTSVLAGVLPSPMHARGKDSVVGTGKLVSATAQADQGDVAQAVVGQHRSGLLPYTAAGRMVAIISDHGRKPLSTADRVGA
jgi:hypothetical protein